MNIAIISKMEKTVFLPKNCIDCGKQISFERFRDLNPSLSEDSASELWKNPLISVYCHDCFFTRPERPYKKRRRDLSVFHWK